jgi:DNA-binding MarR family transcriptional regulator
LPLTPEGRLAELELRQIVGYQLAQATIVSNEVFDQSVGVPHGLRPVDYTILMLVKENPDVSPAQLSKALAMTRPNMSLRIDSLEVRGLMTRQQNITDRRGQHLRVSKTGASLVSKATRLLLEAERAAFLTLSIAEQMMLAELLHKLGRARVTEPASTPSAIERARKPPLADAS